MITFSEAACAYIIKKVEKEKGIGFRLSIKKTGCSGYAYLPEIVNSISPNDLSFEITKGFIVFIDAKWTHLLEGVQVDYVEDEKMGLKQKKLIFVNPNEASRCGCGESFHAS